MKNKKLQEILKQYPDDMEVVLSYNYDAVLNIQKTIVTTWNINEEDDYLKTYYDLDSDDDWDFEREKVEILIID